MTTFEALACLARMKKEEQNQIDYLTRERTPAPEGTIDTVLVPSYRNERVKEHKENVQAIDKIAALCVKR